MATNKKKQNINEYLLEGKVAPHFDSTERYVLASMMMEAHLVQDVRGILNPNDFYSEAHQVICQAIFDESETGKADTHSVILNLTLKGNLDLAGGAYGILVITNEVAVPVKPNVILYCHAIKEASVKRRWIKFCGEGLIAAHEHSESISDMVNIGEEFIKGITGELSERDRINQADEGMEFIKEFDTKAYNEQNDIIDPNRITTGFREWDEINGDLFPGVYVIAGRPGMGKGIHMTESICRMAKHNEIGVINGEMTTKQLLKRLGCNLKSYGNQLYKKNAKTLTPLEHQMVHEGITEASLNLKLHIYDGTRIDKIANNIKLWVRQYGVKCIFADFLTLFQLPEYMERQNKTDTQKTNHIMAVFASLAKDLNVPIILYAQMNRGILGRSGEKEPMLADLKSSGNIEELAYQVAFLHRPEYYDIPGAVEDIGAGIPGLTWFIIAKHRDGLTGRFKLKADLAKSQMKDWLGDNYYEKQKEDFMWHSVDEAEIVPDDDEDFKQRGLPYKD